MIALAEATIDAAGQAAGLASKTAAVHAFCNVVNLDGNCLGRSTLTLEMFASSVGADDPDADPELPEVPDADPVVPPEVLDCGPHAVAQALRACFS